MYYHQQGQTLIPPHPLLIISPLSSTFLHPPLPYSRSSQAEKERSMEFSVFDKEEYHYQPEAQAAFDDDGYDWGIGIGKDQNKSLFGLEDFLLDDQPLSEAEDHHHKEVKGKETQHELPISVEPNNYSSFFPSLPPPLPLSDITLPEHDVAELEWVSRMTDDSQSEMPTYHHHHHQLLLQAKESPPSPTTTTTTIVDTTTNNNSNNRRPRPVDDMVAPIVKAKRSKRSPSLMSVSSSSSWSWGQGKGGHQGAADDGGPSLVFLDYYPSKSSSSSTTTATSSTTTTTFSSCSSFSYSSSSSSSSSQLLYAHQLFDEMPASFPRLHTPYSMAHKKQHKTKTKIKPTKRGIKAKALLHLARETKTKSKATNNNNNNNWGVVVGGEDRRCCCHCGVTKTPQWRTGPMGAKTLCNACGVRYKSGRLLPEYRPACSPTFIGHVHSNSHRKVIEMRRKKQEEEEEEQQSLLVSAAPLIASFSPKRWHCHARNWV